MVPVIYQVDPDNARRDLASPELRGLLDQGYTAGPAFLWQEKRDAEPVLALLLMPPAPPSPERQRFAAGWRWLVALHLTLQALILAAAVGLLLAGA